MAINDVKDVDGHEFWAKCFLAALEVKRETIAAQNVADTVTRARNERCEDPESDLDLEHHEEFWDNCVLAYIKMGFSTKIAIEHSDNSLKAFISRDPVK